MLKYPARLVQLELNSARRFWPRRVQTHPMAAQPPHWRFFTCGTLTQPLTPQSKSLSSLNIATHPHSFSKICLPGNSWQVEIYFPFPESPVRAKRYCYYFLHFSLGQPVAWSNGISLPPTTQDNQRPCHCAMELRWAAEDPSTSVRLHLREAKIEKSSF